MRKTDQGLIVAIGPDVREKWEIGDHVVFNAHSGDKVTLEAESTFFIIREEQIVAKLMQGSAKLINTETAKRLVRERLAESKTKLFSTRWMTTDIIDSLEQDLCDRFDSITVAEGFEF